MSDDTDRPLSSYLGAPALAPSARLRIPDQQDHRITERAVGPYGRAFRLPDVTNPLALPETRAHLASWVVHLPAVHPVWPTYLVSVAHLRPIPGTPDIGHVVLYPDASHEFIVAALSPVYAPWTETAAIEVICEGRRIMHPRYEPFALTPPNVGCHLRGATDREALSLQILVVIALVHGELSPEPVGDLNRHDRWVDVLHRGVVNGRLVL